MSLIVYPTKDWNTFIDLVRADAIIGSLKTDNGYLALTDDAKEAILVETALLIRMCATSLPKTIEPDLELAQAYLAVYATTTDMTAFTISSGAIKKEWAGAVGQEFFEGGVQGSAMDFPPIVVSLLKQYGCKQGGGKFSQSYMGRS